jgi:putative ABC transport system permease protein
VPGVDVVVSANLFQTHRSRMNGLLNTVSLLLAIAWLLAIGLIALVFSMVITSRKREIGVMRALGAGRPTILTTLLSEGLLLALFGGMAGIGLSLLLIYFFQESLIAWMGVPFLFPQTSALILLILEGLAVALATVTPAIFIPTVKITFMDPILAMR